MDSRNSDVCDKIWTKFTVLAKSILNFEESEGNGAKIFRHFLALKVFFNSEAVRCGLFYYFFFRNLLTVTEVSDGFPQSGFSRRILYLWRFLDAFRRRLFDFFELPVRLDVSKNETFFFFKSEFTCLLFICEKNFSELKLTIWILCEKKLFIFCWRFKVSI